MLTFAYPIYLLLLLLVPVCWLLYEFARRSRRGKLRRFGRLEVLVPLMPLVSRYKPALRITLSLVALAALVITFARPWGGVSEQSTSREGIEVVAAVDASNSMLASATDDASGPTRLASAKIMLERMLDAMSNDRIGLVAYAGEAYTLIPVSSDYASAKTFLGTIDPTQITFQGTNIAAAINNATASFTRDKNIGKAIVLITDAEDLENEEEVMAAVSNARSNGVMVNVIGFGTAAGSQINTPEGLFTNEYGEVVTTRLNEELARKIAGAGGGVYVNGVSPDALNVLQKRLKEVKRTSLSSSNLVTHDELFMYFASIALILMVIEAFMVDRKNSLLSRFTFFNKENKE